MRAATSLGRLTELVVATRNRQWPALDQTSREALACSRI